MASWMVLFRVADGLLKDIVGDTEQFIVGNIGPDCGEPNEDWSVFNPPAQISHWMESVDKSGIRSDAFYEQYVRDNCLDKRYPFYVGYYVHLVTDILWRTAIYLPAKEKYREEFAKDHSFIWIIKEDWYDLDHKYLRDHPDFQVFRNFEKINSFPNIYLDYYSDTAIERKITYITNFYTTYEGNLDREYPYLTEETVNTFVAEAIVEIRRDLISKGII
jgi:hypothetical protein